tara:strand:+ start:290 stop:514 length:225 start_codon:yes stop_codon:yes gene_type:complete
LLFKDVDTSYYLTSFKNNNVMPDLFILSQNYPILFDPKTNFLIFSVKINLINITINVLNDNYLRKLINQKLITG